MPTYDRKPPARNDRLPTPRDVIPGIVEPRCHVCRDAHRKSIDKLIAQGGSYSEIGRLFGIDRRSISRHAQEHLGWEQAAIRQIIEDEATAAEENMEEGVSGVLKRRAYAQIALHKAMTALLEDDVTVEPKDALAMMAYLDKQEATTEGAAIDELRVQFNAFVQAIREIAPPEQWQKILDRTREILDGFDGSTPALQAPEDS